MPYDDEMGGTYNGGYGGATTSINIGGYNVPAGIFNGDPGYTGGGIVSSPGAGTVPSGVLNNNPGYTGGTIGGTGPDSVGPDTYGGIGGTGYSPPSFDGIGGTGYGPPSFGGIGGNATGNVGVTAGNPFGFGNLGNSIGINNLPSGIFGPNVMNDTFGGIGQGVVDPGWSPLGNQVRNDVLTGIATRAAISDFIGDPNKDNPQNGGYPENPGGVGGPRTNAAANYLRTAINSGIMPVNPLGETPPEKTIYDQVPTSGFINLPPPLPPGNQAMGMNFTPPVPSQPSDPYNGGVGDMMRRQTTLPAAQTSFFGQLANLPGILSASPDVNRNIPVTDGTMAAGKPIQDRVPSDGTETGFVKPIQDRVLPDSLSPQPPSTTLSPEPPSQTIYGQEVNPDVQNPIQGDYPSYAGRPADGIAPSQQGTNWIGSLNNIINGTTDPANWTPGAYGSAGSTNPIGNNNSQGVSHSQTPPKADIVMADDSTEMSGNDKKKKPAKWRYPALLRRPYTRIF